MKKIVLILIMGFLISPLYSLSQKRSDFYISFDLASFLPVYTAGVKFNYVINPLLTLGYGFNAFWTLGTSVNAEVFAKWTPLNAKNYEMDLSLGLVGGWANEGSFGKTPRQILGLGPHLRFTPVIIKMGNLSLSFLTCGLEIISDFSTFDLSSGNLRDNSGLAFSAYFLGTGFRYYFGE